MVQLLGSDRVDDVVMRIATLLYLCQGSLVPLLFHIFVVDCIYRFHLFKILLLKLFPLWVVLLQAWAHTFLVITLVAIFKIIIHDQFSKLRLKLLLAETCRKRFLL